MQAYTALLPIAKDTFADDMRRAAAGVTMVTTDGAGGREGATVSLLRDRQHAVADDSAGRTGKDSSGRFATWAWNCGSTGSPMLQDALVAFDCRLTGSVAQGIHAILIGEVVSVQMAG